MTFSVLNRPTEGEGEMQLVTAYFTTFDKGTCLEVVTLSDL